ncbi:MAG TPA: hypothetical protein VFA74_20795 [Terriglobales bacterium]|nr:hypothetical protein [Terriglobales bacterium]
MLWRSLSLTVLVLTFISATQATEGQTTAPHCTVSGRITNNPGPGVSVKLKRAEKDPLAYYDGYLADVSAGGSFRFDDVAPGKYRVVAEGTEFMPSEYGATTLGGSGTAIELAAGENREGISITLAPKRIICGKVTDEKGAPLPKVEIYAFLHRKGTDWLALDDPDNMRTVSDTEGNYRLPDLEPGEYFLKAGMSTWFSRFEKLTQIETENFTNAEPVEVGVAEESQCDVNFLMRPRLGYMSRKIRGTIADDPALSGKNLVLSFLEVNPTGAISKWPFDVLNVDRSFDLQAPPAGNYRLTVSNDRFPEMWAGPPPEFHLLASQDVSIGNKEDLNGITLRANPLAALTGHVRLEDSTSRAACPTGGNPGIGIQNNDTGDYYSVELASDGTFAIPNVALGTYSVRFYPFLRGRIFIGSLVMNGHPVEDRRIDLSVPGAHTLEAILSGNLATAAGHLAPDEPVERYEEPWIHPKASLSGRVTNPPADGQLRVKLWAVRFNSNRSFQYSTQPNNDGTFKFDNVDPGIYVLLTDGPGYVISEYGATYPGVEGKAITLAAGQQLRGITLTASLKKPLLCGKVLDESGQPIADVAISAWRKTKYGGYPAADGPPDVVVKDGNFQFNNLIPGRYFVWAEREVFSQNSRAPLQQVMYFPSSPSLDRAQLIDVGSEPDLGCKHNIQFRPAPAFHIRGTVPQNLPHKDEEAFDISLAETNADGAKRWSGVQTKLQPGDHFDFPGVHSGSYIARLTGPYKPSNGQGFFSGPCGPPSPRLVSAQNVTVKGRDVDDLIVDLNSQISVTGQIRFENIPTDSQEFKVSLPQRVSLLPENTWCGWGADLSPERAFTIDHMEAGTYRVDLDLRGPLYVQSILFNGKPVDGRYITLTRGKPAKLDVTVAGDGGEVDAEVTHSFPLPKSYRRDEPCLSKMPAGPWAFLIPDDIPEDGSGVLTGSPTNEGFIEFNGVRPGRYHAVAGENTNLLNGVGPFGLSVWRDRKYLRTVAAFGDPLEVQAGQKIRIKIRASTGQLQDALAEHKQIVTADDHCAGSCSLDDRDGIEGTR